MRWITIGWAALPAAVLAFAEPAGAQTDALHRAVNARMGLQRSELITIDRALPRGARLAVTLPLEGRPVTLDLSLHSVRADGYHVYHDDGRGRLVEVAPGPVNTFRGRIAEEPGSLASASLMSDGLRAVIDLADGARYVLEPVARRLGGAAPGVHVLYHQDDAPESGGVCATAEAEAGELPLGGGGGGSGPEPLAGGAFVAELACDADYPYFLDWGDETEARINSIINAVNTQYETQVGIHHVITAIVVRTSASEPYSSTNANTLLNQFRNEWLANQSAIQRDVAHLFTGRELNGGTIGIAWGIGRICTNGAYCLAQSDCCGGFGCATDLTAHELGHLWGADHCTCDGTIHYTMNPFILCANQFHPTETIPEIISHRNSRTCLNDVEPMGACCFIDGTCLDALLESECAIQNGDYRGDGSLCQFQDCMVSGVCCLPDGTCVQQLSAADCVHNLNGVYQGDGSSCLSDPCSATGACCFTDGTCVEMQEAACLGFGGAYSGHDVPCASGPCPQPDGACCFADGSCSTATAAACGAGGGTFQGAFTTCGGTSCPPPQGACCFASGSCSTTTASACGAGGGSFQGAFTTCGGASCPQPQGACCFASGSCSTTTASACGAGGGSFQGAFTTCGGASCPQPQGACCFSDGACSFETGGACATAGGTYQGDGVECAAARCSPPCAADLNGDGSVGFSDLSLLLKSWGDCPGCPADLDGSGIVGFSDLNALLDAWGPC